MHTYISLLIHDTIALITILNPIAAASIMISLLNTSAPQVIRPVALKATITVLIASLITLYTGEVIFKLFGINVMSLKVFGGVILLMVAIHMVNGQTSKTKHTPEEKSEAEQKEDISIVPLGIPILFGPGTIATIIVLSHNTSKEYSTIVSYGILTLSIVVACVVVYLTLRYASKIVEVLGVTGMKILTRIMGLIVGAIAVQFIVGGIKGLWAML